MRCRTPSAARGWSARHAVSRQMRIRSRWIRAVTGAPTWATGTGPRGYPAIASDGDQGFARNLTTRQETEILRGQREATALRRLRRQATDRGDAGRVGGSRIDGVTPRDQFRVQLGIVAEAAAEEKIALDPLDQRFDAALLVAGARIAGLRMKPAPRGYPMRELQQGRRPHRLTSAVAPTGDRLHVVEDEHPGHPAKRHDAIDQSAEERLLPHIVREADPAPPAVFQPASEEVARRRWLLREREAAHLAPVDLEIFRGQPLEPNRDIARSLLLCLFPPNMAHQMVRPPWYGRSGSARANSSMRTFESPSSSHRSICTRYPSVCDDRRRRVGGLSTGSRNTRAMVVGLRPNSAAI